MMDWIILSLLVLFAFCIFGSYRFGRRMGYTQGVRHTLKEWKAYMGEDEVNERK